MFQASEFPTISTKKYLEHAISAVGLQCYSQGAFKPRRGDLFIAKRSPGPCSSFRRPFRRNARFFGMDGEKQKEMSGASASINRPPLRGLKRPERRRLTDLRRILSCSHCRSNRYHRTNG